MSTLKRLTNLITLALARDKSHIIIGDRNISLTDSVLTIVYNVYLSGTADSQPHLSETEFRQVLSNYLAWVLAENRYLKLHGWEILGRKMFTRRFASDIYTTLKVSIQGASEPNLASGKNNYYVEGKDQEIENLDLSLLSMGKKIVIAGLAGSGKTSYISRLAYKMAESMLDTQQRDNTIYPNIPPLIPIVIPLRFWNVYRDHIKSDSGKILDDPVSAGLLSFMLWFLRYNYSNFSNSFDFFNRLVLGGGALVMFDGLDEVMGKDERIIVRDSILRFIEQTANEKNYYVVTTRESGLLDAPLSEEFSLCEIQPMNQDQIEDLVNSWCIQVPQLASSRAIILKSIIEINDEHQTRGEQPLFHNPLLVTMLLGIRYTRRELPHERAQLYKAFVQTLLEKHYSRDIDEIGAWKMLVTWGGTAQEHCDWLSGLAFSMHKVGVLSINEIQLRDILNGLIKNPDKDDIIEKFVKATSSRGGLLVERDGEFQFIHKTFQEYLASRFIALHWQEFTADLSNWIPDNWWRESILLALGELYKTSRSKVLEFTSYLLKHNSSPDYEFRVCELAATGMLGQDHVEEKLLMMVIPHIQTFFNSRERINNVSVLVIASAGRALSRFGENRVEINNLDDISVCYLPEGPFMMGSQRSGKNEEHPLHLIELDYGFWMSKYPLSKAHWMLFIEQSGYTPEESLSLAGFTNTPATMLTWYEAKRACAWLTEHYRSNGFISKDFMIDLPSEAEWEKAARGGLFIPSQPIIRCLSEHLIHNVQFELMKNPNPLRSFPWGDEESLIQANYDKAQIKQTSSLGCFPGGVSVYGCEELSGNIWEWTRDLWGENWEDCEFKYLYDSYDGRQAQDAPPKLQRIVRGGSFLNDNGRITCSVRGRGFPDRYYRNFGFRFVARPVAVTRVFSKDIFDGQNTMQKDESRQDSSRLKENWKNDATPGNTDGERESHSSLTFPKLGNNHLLRSNRTKIGRHSSNEIWLDYGSVSDKHAVIIKRATQFFIEDTGSSNGTYLNGARLESWIRVQLASGDKIAIGDIECLFTILHN